MGYLLSYLRSWSS